MKGGNWLRRKVWSDIWKKFWGGWNVPVNWEVVGIGNCGWGDTLNGSPGSVVCGCGETLKVRPGWGLGDSATRLVR